MATNERKTNLKLRDILKLPFDDYILLLKVIRLAKRHDIQCSQKGDKAHCLKTLEFYF